MSSPYDHLRNVMRDTESIIEDPYPDLKQLLPVDMVTFAYQIADGMVSVRWHARNTYDQICKRALIINAILIKACIAYYTIIIYSWLYHSSTLTCS